MAVTEKCQPWLWGGAPCRLEKKLIAATQTWGVGSPVYIKDGQVKLAVDCASSAANTSIDGFVYAAVAAPDENTELYIARITADQLWAIWVSSSGNDSAAAVDIIGDQYGHAVESTTPFAGYMSLDLGYTTYLSMEVENVMSNLDTKIVASVSTSPGVAIVHFLQTALDVVGS